MKNNDLEKLIILKKKSVNWISQVPLMKVDSQMTLWILMMMRMT